MITYDFNCEVITVCYKYIYVLARSTLKMAHKWPKYVAAVYIIKLHSKDLFNKVLFIRRTGLKMKKEEAREMENKMEVRNAKRE